MSNKYIVRFLLLFKYTRSWVWMGFRVRLIIGNKLPTSQINTLRHKLNTEIVFIIHPQQIKDESGWIQRNLIFLSRHLQTAETGVLHQSLHQSGFNDVNRNGGLAPKYYYVIHVEPRLVKHYRRRAQRLPLRWLLLSFFSFPLCSNGLEGWPSPSQRLHGWRGCNGGANFQSSSFFYFFLHFFRLYDFG